MPFPLERPRMEVAKVPTNIRIHKSLEPHLGQGRYFESEFFRNMF